MYSLNVAPFQCPIIWICVSEYPDNANALAPLLRRECLSIWSTKRGMHPDRRLYQTGVRTVHPQHRLTPLTPLMCATPNYVNQVCKCIARGRHRHAVDVIVLLDAFGRDVVVSIPGNVDKFEVCFMFVVIPAK
jgi:hypothetical protein